MISSTTQHLYLSMHDGENPKNKRMREDEECSNLIDYIKRQRSKPLRRGNATSNSNSTMSTISHSSNKYFVSDTILITYGLCVQSPYMILDPKDIYTAEMTDKGSKLLSGCSFDSSTSNTLKDSIGPSCPPHVASKILKCKLKTAFSFRDSLPQFVNAMVQLVSEKQDDFEKIYNIIEKLKKKELKRDDMGNDIQWWIIPQARPFALFRRLLQPIQRILRKPTSLKTTNAANNNIQSTKTTFKVQRLNISLLHILLRIESIQLPLIHALFQRLDKIQGIIKKQRNDTTIFYCLRDLILDHLKDLIQSKEDIFHELKFINTVQSCLSKIEDDVDDDDPLETTIHDELSPLLHRMNKNHVTERQITNYSLPSKSQISIIQKKTVAEKKVKGITNGNIIGSGCNNGSNSNNNYKREYHYVNSLPPALKTEEQKIRAEIKLLLDEASQTHQNISESSACRRSYRRPKLKNRAFDGSLIFDSDQISRENFIARTKFMNRVNEKFQRRFRIGYSRPTLKRLQFSKETLLEIRNIFFDEDGSLSNSVIGDIDISISNDPRLISFGKMTTSSVRDDKRWQVSIRKHSLGSTVPTKTKLEQIYLREGVISPSNDDLHEVAILIGGTEDQRLHHDVARQMAIWYKEKPSTIDKSEKEPPLTGWEVDRIQYNQSMESPFAPSSSLIALGKSGKFLLGIQKDQIFLTPDGTSCKIIGGCGTSYKIVRSNENLVVVVVPSGCIFTGDFPHCGVRNFEKNSSEEDLMEKCQSNIDCILKEIPSRERILRSQKIIQMMCKLPGLAEICRLHSSTEMVDGPFRQPRNAVGFSYCQINERDARCIDQENAAIPNTEISVNQTKSLVTDPILKEP